MLSDKEIAARLDLARHVNDGTGELGDVLTSALLDELGMEQAGEAQDLAMTAVAKVIRHFDGRRLRVTSARTAMDAIAKDKARQLFADGKTLSRVVAQTSLSEYQARKVREDLDEVCSAGVLGASPAQA